MAKISVYDEQVTLLDTDLYIIEDTVANKTKKVLFSTFSSLIVNEPIGTTKSWDKSNTSTPALPDSYKECDGSLISDVSSVYNSERIENLNGADVVLTLTWTADAGGAYATVASADLPALSEGDDVTGSGIAASSYISDITGTTVTITDVSATGSIASTFTNDGLFISGASASGTGKKDHMQQITGSVSNQKRTINDGGFVSISGAFASLTDGTTQGSTAVGASARLERIANFDSSSSPNARTDTSTYPSHRKYVMIKKIK